MPGVGFAGQMHKLDVQYKSENIKKIFARKSNTRSSNIKNKNSFKSSLNINYQCKYQYQCNNRNAGWCIRSVY